MADVAAPAALDAVVIGGGPAGLAAATWLARYRRRVLVLDSSEYRNAWVDSAHGYLGSDPMSPADLRERARHDLARYADAVVRAGVRVCDIARDADEFILRLDDDSTVRALRLVLATGVRDSFPEIDGFFEHYGADVFHCPTCDGYELAERDVVAIGWNEHLAGFSLNLLDWARSVTIVTEGLRFRGEQEHREALARHDVRIVEDDAVAFVGTRGALRGVRLASGEEIPCQGAAFSIAHHPRNELAQLLGCELTGEGCVIVDDECETTVRGVYAAGDLTPGMQLVQVAASKGTVAGIACAQSLRGESGSPASPEPGPDPHEELP